MASALLRLVALVSLMLVPVGTAGSPALAQPADIAAAHCGEHRHPAETPERAQKQHCAACAALPAIHVPEADSHLTSPPLLAGAPVEAFAGTEPDIATPPPKLA